MLDDYILDDMDSFEIESDDSYSDDKFEYEGTEDFEHTDSFFDSSEDSSSPLLDDENISNTNSFIEPDNQFDSSAYRTTQYRPVAFGHSLGWNGRCRVCSCGAWAGFGDTCACCGHFYKDHI